ncbi:Clavaminate synthase-like protein [Acephala macrosclerotiorum]|nr:Clavaminate synthase-like protein [Acephala macrosclerotiorum]
MGSVAEVLKAPPILDFSVFRSSGPEVRSQLIQHIRSACQDKGFFQITNHGVSSDLQERLFSVCKSLFALPLKEKIELDRNKNKYNRGFERHGSQMLEPGTAPESKEGLYLGEHLLADNPRVVRGDYKYFEEFATDSVGTLRFIHYPTTPTTNDKHRGIGAHRDFGCITLFMQDSVGGLQVLDQSTNSWVDVKPVPGAYVVNLGNLMMKWTNGRYTSNLHRVMNFSERDRYSTPFFFNGNPNFAFDVGEAGEVIVKGFLREQFDKSYVRVKG